MLYERATHSIILHDDNYIFAVGGLTRENNKSLEVYSFGTFIFSTYPISCPKQICL